VRYPCAGRASCSSNLRCFLGKRRVEACNGDKSLPWDVERDRDMIEWAASGLSVTQVLSRRRTSAAVQLMLWGGRTTFVTWIVAGGNARNACRAWAAELFSRPSLCERQRRTWVASASGHENSPCREHAAGAVRMSGRIKSRRRVKVASIAEWVRQPCAMTDAERTGLNHRSAAQP
jgi:hypothetical protein